MRRNAIKLACALLALLGGSAEAAPQGARAQLDTIAHKCGFPATVLKLKGGLLHMQPPPNAGYRQVHCLIVAARKAGFRTPTGFVGSETYDPKAR